MARLNVGGDVVNVPDGLTDDQYDAIAKQHVRSKGLDATQEAARADMAGRDPFTRAAYGFANTIAEPIVGLGQAGRRALGMDTGRTDEQIATMRGAREGAGGMGTVGEVGAFMLPGGATTKLVGRALPKALGLAGRVAAPVIAGGAEQAAYNASRGTLPGDQSRGEAAAEGALWGAGGAAAGQAVPRVLGRAVALVRASPQARALADWAEERGVDLMGQMSAGQAAGRGSLVGGIEEALMAVPGVKQLIERRRAGGVDAWNKAQLESVAGGLKRNMNEAVGEAGPKGIEYVQGLVDDAYRGATRGVRILVPEGINPFKRTADMIAELPPAEREIAQQHLNNTLAATRSGKLEGDAITEYRSKIDKLGSQHFRKGDYQLGEVLDQLDDDFRELSAHFMSPKQRELLGEANDAYRRLKPINRAAAMKGALENEGRFTPSQLVRGVTRGQPESVVARQAPEQLQEALQAGQVLGNTLPRPGPGTAEKLATMALFGGAGGAAADLAQGNDPLNAGAPLLGVGTAGLAAALLAPAGNKQLLVAELLRRTAPASGRTLSAAAAAKQREAEERRRRGY